jgi:hypothetical protein
MEFKKSLGFLSAQVLHAIGLRDVTCGIADFSVTEWFISLIGMY